MLNRDKHLDVDFGVYLQGKFRPELPFAVVADTDGVSLDYVTGLREFYNAKYGKQIRGQNPLWEMSTWLETSPEEAFKVMIEFAQHWRFSCLDAMPGAETVLHQLVRDDIKIINVTACGTDERTVNSRKANLWHRFGDIFEATHFVGLNESKTDILKDIDSKYNILAFLDDKPANLYDAHEIGILNTILMRQVHNKPYRDQFPHTYSWWDVKDHVYSNLKLMEA